MWRLPHAARDPLVLEGVTAMTLWEAGAAAVWVDEHDLLAAFEQTPTGPLPSNGTWEAADPRDYVGEYFANLGPVDAGAVVIAPTHRTVTLQPAQRVVWLDPGTAFGSGHHETTRMALAALGELELAGARVLDVGAGSGVLALAADALGAAHAHGIDIDASTVPVARANAVFNCANATFAHAGFDQFASDQPYDVVVANLYAELHQRFWPDYARALRSGGELLLTGILAIHRDALERDLHGGVAHAVGLEAVSWRQDGAWLLLHARKRV